MLLMKVHVDATLLSDFPFLPEGLRMLIPASSYDCNIVAIRTQKVANDRVTIASDVGCELLWGKTADKPCQGAG